MSASKVSGLISAASADEHASSVMTATGFNPLNVEASHAGKQIEWKYGCLMIKFHPPSLSGYPIREL